MRGIKDLAFPQQDIDRRLYEAHTHTNQIALDQLTVELLNKISNSALKDLTNVDDTLLTNRIDNLRYVKDVDDTDSSVAYIRKLDRWVKLNEAQLKPTLISQSLDVVDFSSATSDDPLKATVELKPETKAILNDVANKINKLPNVKDNLLLVSKDQSAAASDIELSTVLTKSNVYNGYANNPDDPLSAEEAATTPVSAAAIFLLASSLGLTDGTEAALSIPTFKGIVDSLYDNKSMLTISGISKMDKSEGTTFQNQLFYSMNSVSPCVVKVSSINSDNNKPKVIELLSGGSWLEEVTSVDLFAPNGATMTIIPQAFESKVITTLPQADSCVVGDTIIVGYNGTGNKSIWRIAKNSSNDKVWEYVCDLGSGSSNTDITNITNLSNSYLYEDPSLTPTDASYFDYTLNDDNTTVTITGVKSDMTLPSEVVIPAIIDGHVVNKLGDKAFQNNSDMTSIIFPTTIKSAGIGVLDGCSKLKYIDMGGCERPDGLFASRCPELLKVKLCSQLRTLPYMMFGDCTKLSGIVTIPATVNINGNFAFTGCTSLKRLIFLNSDLNMDGDLEDGAAINMDNPSAVTIVCEKDSRVEEWAKARKYSILYNITTTSNNVTNVTKIANFYAYSDPSLVPTDESLFNYEEQADGTISITGIKNEADTPAKLVIPPTIEDKLVTYIAGNAFQNNTKITEAILPNTVNNTGNDVFNGCSNLTYIDMGNCLEAGHRFAAGCSKLTKVKLSSRLTTLSYHMFSSTGLSGTIIIPASVTYIQEEAFGSCNAITRLVFSNSNITAEYQMTGVTKINSDDPSKVTFVCERNSEAERWAIHDGYSVLYNVGDGAPILKWQV